MTADTPQFWGVLRFAAAHPAEALLWLGLAALLGFATLPLPLAYAAAALLLFALAFLSLIVPSLVAISEDVELLDRDFRFTATRLRLGLPSMGDF